MAWEQHGEIFRDAGDIGGDKQVGESTSIRFVNPDLRGRVITIYAYPVGVSHLGEDGDQVKVTGIQSATEFMICTDVDNPGDTEVWSDCLYIDETTRPFAELGAAERTAAGLLTLADPKNINWNGEPF